MNRKEYYDFIDKRLQFLAYEIAGRAKKNLLDLNIHSENFFINLFNIIFDLELINANSLESNCGGIDLIDEKHSVVIQVPSTSTNKKIQDSLYSQVFKNKYIGYRLKFIFIGRKTKDRKEVEYINPYNVIFNPKNDIWDIDDILGKILYLDVDKLKAIYELVGKEILPDFDYGKTYTNLAAIVKILTKENFNINEVDAVPLPFNIDDKISINQLDSVKAVIDDYKVFHHRLNNIYNDFDREGQNKSHSILCKIRSQYFKLIRDKNKTSVEIFDQIIKSVTDIIVYSENYQKMPEEELFVCVNIIVVDAFIRCKIFNSPTGYSK